MPKATRKKKLKQADFQVSLQKEAQGRQEAGSAANVTDVSFKSQKISLRPQRIAAPGASGGSGGGANATAATAASDPAAVAAKQQRIRDVLAQCRHYSPQNRKDAVGQLHDLLSSEAMELASMNLGAIANDVAALILDESQSVRTALLTFFTSYVSWIDEMALMPFGAVIIAFATSAMSHISDSIRADGLRMLKILVPRFPNVIVKHYHTILPHFLDLLSAHTKSRSASGGRGIGSFGLKSELNELKGREQLLEGFYHFIKLVLRPKALDGSNDQTGTQTSFFGEVLSTKSSGRVSILAASATKILGASRAHSLTTSKDMEDLLELLFPALVDFWIESSDVFDAPKLAWSPSIGICLLVIQILLAATRESPNSLAAKNCAALLKKHMLPNFPFAGSAMTNDERIDKALAQINLGFASILLSLHSLAGPQDDTLSIVSGVSVYVVNLLSSSEILNSNAPALNIAALESVISALCSHGHETEALIALIKFQKGTKSMSAAYGTFGILSRMEITSSHAAAAEFEMWILSLARQLRQIRTWNPAFTKDVLVYLSHMSKIVSESLQAAILPFLYNPPKEGKKAKFGPLIELSDEVQQCTVDLLYFLCAWSPAMVEAIAECFTQPEVSDTTALAMLDVIMARQRMPERALSPSVYGSLLVTVCLGYTRRYLNEAAESEPTDRSLPKSVTVPSTKPQTNPQLASVASLLERRQQMVEIVSADLAWGYFAPSLALLLNQSLPIDAQFGILSMLAQAASGQQPTASMDRQTQESMAKSLHDLIKVSNIMPSGGEKLRIQCAGLVEKLQSRWPGVMLH
ncbi:hypothetical protein BC831DRAFT_514141 [Entophlyctis helioformis]|nr:hypothetical protein BC831DRAFT_514141 [Entophlyctis helioformis]